MRTFTRGLAAVATATAVTLAPMSIASAQSSLSSSSSSAPAPGVPSPSPSPTPSGPTNTEGEARLEAVLEGNLRGRGNVTTPAGNGKAEQWVQRAVNGEVYFTTSEWVKSISDPEGGVLVVRIPKSELNYYLSIIQGDFSGIRNGQAGVAVASDGEYFYGSQVYLY